MATTSKQTFHIIIYAFKSSPVFSVSVLKPPLHFSPGMSVLSTANYNKYEYNMSKWWRPTPSYICIFIMKWFGHHSRYDLRGLSCRKLVYFINMSVCANHRGPFRLTHLLLRFHHKIRKLKAIFLRGWHLTLYHTQVGFSDTEVIFANIMNWGNDPAC